MYTEEEICLDMMVTYVLLPETIVESACQTFEGTRQEYIDQYIVPGGGEIQTERL